MIRVGQGKTCEWGSNTHAFAAGEAGCPVRKLQAPRRARSARYVICITRLECQIGQGIVKHPLPETETVRLRPAILGALSAGHSLRLGAAARNGHGRPVEPDRATPHGDRRFRNDACPRPRRGVFALIVFKRFGAAARTPGTSNWTPMKREWCARAGDIRPDDREHCGGPTRASPLNRGHADAIHPRG